MLAIWLVGVEDGSPEDSGEICVVGVPPTGRRIETQEFAFYRVDGGLIVEVWMAADNLGLLDQLR